MVVNMETQSFVQYLKNIIGGKLKEWENNLLTGAYKTHEETQRAVGVRDALSSVVTGVDTVLQNYLTEKNAPPLPSSVTLLNPEAPDTMPTDNQ